MSSFNNDFITRMESLPQGKAFNEINEEHEEAKMLYGEDTSLKERMSKIDTLVQDLNKTKNLPDFCHKVKALNEKMPPEEVPEISKEEEEKATREMDDFIAKMDETKIDTTELERETKAQDKKLNEMMARIEKTKETEKIEEPMNEIDEEKAAKEMDEFIEKLKKEGDKFGLEELAKENEMQKRKLNEIIKRMENK